MLQNQDLGKCPEESPHTVGLMRSFSYFCSAIWIAVLIEPSDLPAAAFDVGKGRMNKLQTSSQVCLGSEYPKASPLNSPFDFHQGVGHCRGCEECQEHQRKLDGEVKKLEENVALLELLSLQPQEGNEPAQVSVDSIDATGDKPFGFDFVG